VAKEKRKNNMAPKAAEQGLVQNPPNALTKRVDDLPEYLRGAGTLGMEEVEKNDVAMPRIALCQSNTPQRKKSDPKYIEGLDEGMFFNTATGRVYGESFRFIPIKYFKQRILFYPIDDGGGIDCQSLNGIDGGHYSPTCATCPKKDFVGGPEGGKPSCFEFQNRVGLVLPDGDVAATSFKSTAIPASKQWSAIAKLRNAPLFSAIYEIRAVPAVRKGNNFFAVTVKLIQNVSPDDFKYAKGLYESLSEKVLVVDQTGENPEDTDFSPTTSTEM
jgi:hypothetical protein